MYIISFSPNEVVCSFFQLQDGVIAIWC